MGDDSYCNDETEYRVGQVAGGDGDAVDEVISAYSNEGNPSHSSSLAFAPAASVNHNDPFQKVEDKEAQHCQQIVVFNVGLGEHFNQGGCYYDA